MRAFAEWRVAGLVALAAVLGASPAPAQSLTVTDRDCAQLIAHAAANDVNYKPGVDVYGRPVAPADLNPSSQIQMPQSFTIDVNADLRKYGIPSSSPLLLPSTKIGQLRVEDGGRSVYFNDQPIGNSEQTALAEACKARQSQKR
jgi:hypothetical protein